MAISGPCVIDINAVLLTVYATIVVDMLYRSRVEYLVLVYAHVALAGMDQGMYIFITLGFTARCSIARNARYRLAGLPVSRESMTELEQDKFVRCGNSV